MSTFNNTTGATSVDAAAVGRSSTSPFVDIFMARDPTPQDNQHSIQKKWLNTVANTFWILESYSTISGVTLANWVPITGATASITFVENFGSATPTSGVLNVLGGTGVETFGVGDTITITASGLVAQEYLGNVGFAIPVDGDLNILGTGGITTTGSGNTISIANSSSVATLYTENTGTAVPSGGNLHVIGTGGITTSGSGNVITISGSGGGGSETLTGNTGGAVSPDGSNNINVQGDVTTVMIAGDPATHTLTVSAVQTIYDEDTGSATPSSGVLNIHGGTGVTTSGSGNTVTINASPIMYNENTGSATPASGILQILGINGITTAGSGNTVTISGSSLISSVSNKVFTSSGTYTPTTGMAYCYVQCLGGGGAGGGAASASSGMSNGGGGGGGEYSAGIFSAATIGGSQTVTIGAGGTGVTASIGGNGGTSSLGSLISSFGGTGGNLQTLSAPCIVYGVAGTGGTGGSGGDYRTQGQNGVFAHSFSGAGINFFNTGAGANSQLGSGGVGSAAGSTGPNGTGYGAGGAGSGSNFSSSSLPGGNGSPGIIIITEYIG